LDDLCHHVKKVRNCPKLKKEKNMLKTLARNKQLPESISMSENDFGLDKISFNIRVASKTFLAIK